MNSPKSFVRKFQVGEKKVIIKEKSISLLYMDVSKYC